MADDSDRDSSADEEQPANDEQLDENGDEASSEEAEEEAPPLEPDHQDAIAALTDCGCRLDVDDSGHVWRIFLFDKNGDETLAQIHGLPGLKDLWVLGSKASPKMVEQFKEQFPKVKVYG